MSTHAALSASQSERWMMCPGSITLCEKVGKQPSSYAAKEGTAAHEAAALCLEQGLEPIELVGRVFTVDGEKFEVDEEMAEALKIYTDYVAKLLAERPNAKFYVEKKFNLNWLRPDMYGTNDACIFEIGTELIVIDLKYGKGVIVEPEQNSQLMYYGLGALYELTKAAITKQPDWENDPLIPKSVRLVIVQPRARHDEGPIREWSLPIQNLWSWRIDLADAADETYKDNAPLMTGDHCRWCDATGICPKLRNDVQTQAQLDFQLLDPATDVTSAIAQLNPHDLENALTALPVVETWCKGVAAAAQAYLENGGQLNGFKLVRKKSNRTWKDEEKVLEAVKKKRFKASDYLTEPKLKSPAQLEKIKAIGKDFVAEYCHKPLGGLTVADDTDPREAVKGRNLFEESPLIEEDDIFA